MKSQVYQLFKIIIYYLQKLKNKLIKIILYMILYVQFVSFHFGIKWADLLLFIFFAGVYCSVKLKNNFS